MNAWQEELGPGGRRGAKGSSERWGARRWLQKPDTDFPGKKECQPNGHWTKHKEVGSPDGPKKSFAAASLAASAQRAPPSVRPALGSSSARELPDT